MGWVVGIVYLPSHQESLHQGGGQQGQWSQLSLGGLHNIKHINKHLKQLSLSIFLCHCLSLPWVLLQRQWWRGIGSSSSNNNLGSNHQQRGLQGFVEIGHIPCSLLCQKVGVVPLTTCSCWQSSLKPIKNIFLNKGQQWGSVCHLPLQAEGQCWHMARQEGS